MFVGVVALRYKVDNGVSQLPKRLKVISRNYRYEQEWKLGKFFSHMFVMAKKLKSCLPLLKIEYLLMLDVWLL